MKKLTIISCFVFALLLVVSSCSHRADNVTLSNKNSYSPTNITFSEYSISETGCEWASLDYPNDSEVVVINSQQEFENFIIYPDKSTVPTIDFSKHSLLLARGIEPYDINAAIKNLQQISTQNYVMSVELDPNLAAVLTNWQVAIITRKLATEDKVLLEVANKE